MDCFCNISLPPRLADYYYERVRKQHGITDEVLPVVFHSGSLQADLAGNPITGRGLTHLRKCVKLKKLTLSSNPADAFDENSLLETLRCFHELEEVQLTGLRGVTPEVVSVIAEQNKNLTTLRLDKCPNVDDACLRALGEGCPSLKHVSFSSTQVNLLGLMTNYCFRVCLCGRKLMHLKWMAWAVRRVYLFICLILYLQCPEGVTDRLSTEAVQKVEHPLNIHVQR